MTTLELTAPDPAEMRKARDLYAANPSHYLDIKPDGERERGCLCVIEACQAAAVEFFSFKRFLGVGSMAVWNARSSTEEVLAEWDLYIASLETPVAA